MSGVADELSVAIIAMHARLPGARDVNAFWRNVCAGHCSIDRLDAAALERLGVSAERQAEPGFVGVAANIEDLDLFDAEFFGIGAREAQALDPQHRLLLEGARDALESAGYDPHRYDGEIGVFFGTAISHYFMHNLLPQPEVMRSLGDDYTVFGSQSSYACTRVANRLNLRGPILALDTACSSSLVAVHLACKSLLNFECDMALAGGAQVNLPQHSGYVYQEGSFQAPDGVCRAFDAGARGTVFGSGVGVVLLKRLEDARRDGDQIVAVIRGSAINNDGADKVSFTAPGVRGQTAVIEKALGFSGVDADTIGYVETHGTGTPLGDPIEIAALTAAWRASTQRSGYCAIGSLKPNIGHIETASGVAGLMKAAMAVKHGVMPPSLHFEQANPQIDFPSTPFFVNDTLRDWRRADGPRRAAVSAFGVGGSNAHLILEEYQESPRVRPARSQQLLLWSAKTEDALAATGRRLATHLREQPHAPLADVAYTLARGREAFAHRRMLVCDGLASAIAGIEGGAAAHDSAIAQERAPGVAFLFPGQGAQHARMCVSLYREEPVFRETLQRCASLLAAPLGRDLLAVLYPPEVADAAQAEREEAALAQTWLTQPALFSVEYALARQWQAWGIEPSAMLGHSIGEYVAACLAGVFTLEDALRVVAARGRLMQELPAGEMLSVPLTADELQSCSSRGWDLAAVNAPGVCVASGPPETIAALERELTARGIESRRLRTSHAFHSATMEPILARFAAELAGVRLAAPALRFLSNVTGDWITDAQATSVDYWVRHLRSTVQFSCGVDKLLAERQLVLLEVGPGQTLSPLLRQQPNAVGRTVVSSQPHARESRDAHAAMLVALGRLWLANVSIDWDGFYAGEQRRRVPLPGYPHERKRYWIDPPAAGQVRRDTPVARTRDLPDWFHVPRWSMAPLSPVAPPRPGVRWLLFRDQAGVAAALAARLRARGDEVVEVDAGESYRAAPQFTIRADAAEDYTQLLADLAQSGPPPSRIVHAWCVDRAGDDYEHAQRMGFFSLLRLAQALGTGATPVELTLLTAGLADVLGTEPLDALKGAVLGPAKVVGQEYPHLRCRHVDVLAGEMDCDALLAELDLAAGAPCVAWRGRRRWQLDHAPLRLEHPPDASPWRTGGTYWITGGLGGLGFAFAEHLARDHRARLVLTARQSLPPREQWSATRAALGPDHAVSQRIAAVEKLESLGAEVLVVAADATDRAAMRAALAAARARFGAIHGAMHAAGIAGGGIMQRKTCEQAAAVLAPKVLGAQVLLETLAGEALDFVVLHSSLYAVTGGVGQVDYCGANAALDLIAQQRARDGARIVALDWNAWREVGMAARAGFEGAIAPADGVQALERALRAGVPQLVVTPVSLEEAMQDRDSAGPAPGLGKHERPALDTDLVRPRHATERALVAIWQDVLGLREVGIRDNFFDLGGTSLLLSEVCRRAQRDLGISNIGITDLFKFPTIQLLAARIAGVDDSVADIDATVDLANRRKEAQQHKRRRMPPPHRQSNAWVST